LEKKPNTICKNRDCNKGADGGRKHYYTCRYCVHTENWRSVACSIECYHEYMKQVEEARSGGVIPDTTPERTDMTHEEVRKLIDETPIEEAIAMTTEELAQEIEADPYHGGFGDIVDAINEELDKKAAPKRKKKVEQDA